MATGKNKSLSVFVHKLLGLPHGVAWAGGDSGGNVGVHLHLVLSLSTSNHTTRNLRSIITILTSFRFIPNREGQDLQASFSLLHDEGSPATPSKQKKRPPYGELHFQKSKCQLESLYREA